MIRYYFYLLAFFCAPIGATVQMQSELEKIRAQVFDIQCNQNLSRKLALERSEEVVSKLDDLSSIYPNRAEPLTWKAQALISTLAYLDEWQKHQAISNIEKILTQALERPARLDQGRAQMLKAVLHSEYRAYLQEPMKIGEIDHLFTQAYTKNKSKDVAFNYAFFMLKIQKPQNAVRLFREARESYLSFDLNAYESYFNAQCEKAFSQIHL